jgi:hypothetical protein
MTPRNARRILKRVAEQAEREANGAPMDAETAAHMTQPDEKAVYQVLVMANGKPTPVGFRAEQSVVENFAAAIRAEIKAGREKTWSEPLVVRI